MEHPEGRSLPASIYRQVWEEDIQIDFLSDRSAYELKKKIRKI